MTYCRANINPATILISNLPDTSCQLYILLLATHHRMRLRCGHMSVTFIISLTNLSMTIDTEVMTNCYRKVEWPDLVTIRVRGRAERSLRVRGVFNSFQSTRKIRLLTALLGLGLKFYEDESVWGWTDRNDSLDCCNLQCVCL